MAQARVCKTLDAGSIPAAASQQVVVDAWWEAATAHLNPNTRVGYCGMLRRYILPTLGTRRIDKVKPLDLERWYARLVVGTDATSSRPLSPLTVRKVHMLRSGIFSSALRWGWLPVNPVQRARAPRVVMQPVQAPEPEEIARALDAAEESGDDELHMFLRLSAALGTRRGETSALHWCDVDLEHGDVFVHRSLAADEFDPTLVLEKNTKRHARSRSRAASRSMTIRTCSLRIRTGSCRSIRITSGTGTGLAAAGVPMTVVRDRLRHSSLRTTSMYAHPRRALDRVAADAIGGALPRANRGTPG